MDRFFDYANQYVEESDWRVIAVLKFCLLSLGILFGLQVPQKKKKCVGAAAAFVFLVTYLPLMAKLIEIVMADMSEDEPE